MPTKKPSTSLDINLLLPILEEMGMSFEELTKAIIAKYGTHGEAYYIEKIKSSLSYDKANKGHSIEILMEEIYVEIENKNDLDPTIMRFIAEEENKLNDPVYQNNLALKQELQDLEKKLKATTGKAHETLRTRLIEIKSELEKNTPVSFEGLENFMEVMDDAFVGIEKEVEAGFENVIAGLDVEEDVIKDIKKKTGISNNI